MSSNLHRLWFLVACVWLSALGLTYWNYGTIQAVGQFKQTNDQLRKESVFQRQNVKHMEQIAASQAALFLEVESLDLGLIAVKRRMEALSIDFDLHDLQVRTEINPTEDDFVPCTLTLRGSFQNGVAFIDALSSYPYLMIKHSNFLVSMEDNDVAIQLALSVRYKITVQQTPFDLSPLIGHQPVGQAANPI